MSTFDMYRKLQSRISVFEKLINTSKTGAFSMGIKVPIGLSFTISWGDGGFDTYSGQGDTIISVSHFYTLSGNKSIYVSGYATSKITYLSCPNSNISYIYFTKMSSVTYFDFNTNSFMIGDFSSVHELIYLDYHNNNLTATHVNNILISLVSNDKENGFVNLEQSDSRYPAGLGLIAMNTLIDRGWTVRVR